jgi:hypothetical protein
LTMKNVASLPHMVLALEGFNAKAVRTTQLCISEGAWDDEALLKRHGQEVDTSLGEDEGVLSDSLGLGYVAEVPHDTQVWRQPVQGRTSGRGPDEGIGIPQGICFLPAPPGATPSLAGAPAAD